METLRKPFQGVCNILRFNWHYYVLALFVFGIGFTLLFWFFKTDFAYILLLPLLLLIISLVVSWYVYDASNLYSLEWLSKITVPKSGTIVNINAGFDETSVLLKNRYPGCDLQVLDFYNPTKHTEVSIKRARKAYAPYPGTVAVSTENLLVDSRTVDAVFLVLSAHEIRNKKERILFFKQLKMVLKNDGKIIIVEHLRDFPNFLAYTIGFFHFYSKQNWKYVFFESSLKLQKEFKITPFISTFILDKDDNTP